MARGTKREPETVFPEPPGSQTRSRAAPLRPISAHALAPLNPSAARSSTSQAGRFPTNQRVRPGSNQSAATSLPHDRSESTSWFHPISAHALAPINPSEAGQFPTNHRIRPDSNQSMTTEAGQLLTNQRVVPAPTNQRPRHSPQRRDNFLPISAYVLGPSQSSSAYAPRRRDPLLRTRQPSRAFPLSARRRQDGELACCVRARARARAGAWRRCPALRPAGLWGPSLGSGRAWERSVVGAGLGSVPGFPRSLTPWPPNAGAEGREGGRRRGPPWD